MNKGGLIVAGAIIGLGAWYFIARRDWEQAAGMLNDGGGDYGLMDFAAPVDDFYYEQTGLRMAVGGWIDDLNGRGAPYKAALAVAEIKNGIPPMMLARLAWQESRFRPDIVSGQKKSSAGAVGIMQIVPRWHPSVDPYDPFESIDYAATFLARLFKKFGNWEYALKAYNWGEGNVAQWLAGKKAEPMETRNYSAQILADVQSYKELSDESGGTLYA
jgi:soluble lytic murein transglycosylase-like protein